MKKSRSTARFLETTINGHSALTIEEVQFWFKKYDCVAPSDAAASIAVMLNHCAFLAAEWKNTPELKARRRNNPSLKQMKRIGIALRTLQADLPPLIGDSLKISPNRHANGLVAVVALLDSVNLLAPGFQKFMPRSRGREPELWHNIARNLGPTVISIFKSSSGRRVGFGKPTSPGIAIIQSALAFLGVKQSPEAIVDAMRLKRRRTIKRLGK